MSPRIFFIGDSFTNGTGDPAALGWVGRVCAAAMAQSKDLTIYNLGIRGDTTELINQRWQQEVNCRLAETAGSGFVFSFGANDVDLDEETAQPRVSRPESLGYAQTMLSLAQRIGPVLMVESPPIADDEAANERLVLLNAELSDLCQSLAIPFIATCQQLLENDDWMEEAIAHDGVHPRAKGYAVLAQIILDSSAWQQWLMQF